MAAVTEIKKDELKVENTKDLAPATNVQIIVLGPIGSGKTTLFATHPGKKFAYLFDNNAARSLRGYDVDYKEFMPDRIPLNISSLSGKVKADKATVEHASETYNKWEEDFEKRMNSGFFDDYDCLCFDSITTFSDMVMDRVLEINGRGGMWPQQDDYGPQMNAIIKVMRTVVSMGKDLFVTGHIEIRQDDTTKRIMKTPLMTGRLRVKLPLLFSEVWRAESEVNPQSGETKFFIRTKPSHNDPDVRCSFRGLKSLEDVTIDMSKPVDNQGLARIFEMEREEHTHGVVRIPATDNSNSSNSS